MPAKTVVRPDWNWQRDALCRGEDLVLFFGPDGERQPERDARERKAKAICAQCPVKAACGDYSISRPEKYGTWSGLNEDERASERRRRMRGEATAALKAKLEKVEQEAEERRARNPGMFPPPDPARDLELLRDSDQFVAAGGTMRDAARALGVPRTTLTDARKRAHELLAGAS